MRNNISNVVRLHGSFEPLGDLSHPPVSRQVERRQQTEYIKEEDFIFASAALKGKQPFCGQNMNAQLVKPAAVELGLVDAHGNFGKALDPRGCTWSNFCG